MRAVLLAFTDELKRLKAAGVKMVSVSDESLATLQRLVAARKTGERKPASAEAVTDKSESDLTQSPRPKTLNAAATALPPPPGWCQKSRSSLLDPEPRPDFEWL